MQTARMDIEVESSPYKDFLGRRPLREISSTKKELVFIDVRTTIEEALQTMARERLIALPAYDTTRKDFPFIIDLWDIMSFIAFADYFNGIRNMHNFLDPRLLKEPVSSVAGSIGSSSDRMIRTFENNVPLLDLMKPMSASIKRVLVAQMWSKFDRLVTQTDIVKFLYEHRFELGPKVNMSLEELGINLKPVITVNRSDQAIEGFRRVHDADVGAVAVVGTTTHALYSTLSASDLRGMTSDNINDVFLTVEAFLRKQHHGSIIEPVTVRKDAELADIMRLIVEKRIHRVWVSNDQGFPEGVVSLSDIIGVFS